MIKKEGIGSYFHHEKAQNIKNNVIELNFDYKVFYTGRHALLHILNEITCSKKIAKIWFPNYYCQHTLNWIKKSYPDIFIYEVNPFEFKSDEININEFAKADDVVLINNYWGLSTMLTEKSNPNLPIIIEDHSHGWLSNKCMKSNADYCFVSLRKSLPIPLGGIYWTPNSIIPKDSNFKEDKEFYKIWDLMIKAMNLKSEYIDGSETINNQTYLELFYDVEKSLNTYTDFVELTNDHKSFINSYINLNTRKIKEENLNYIYKKVQDTTYYKVIKRNGYTAFGLHLLFKDEIVLNSLKKFLVSKKIYPSSLWPDNKINYSWKYFLNIHIDFRYDIYDMDYIVSTINDWLKSTSN